MYEKALRGLFFASVRPLQLVNARASSGNSGAGGVGHRDDYLRASALRQGDLGDLTADELSVAIERAESKIHDLSRTINGAQITFWHDIRE